MKRIAFLIIGIVLGITAGTVLTLTGTATATVEAAGPIPTVNFSQTPTQTTTVAQTDVETLSDGTTVEEKTDQYYKLVCLAYARNVPVTITASTLEAWSGTDTEMAVFYISQLSDAYTNVCPTAKALSTMSYADLSRANVDVATAEKIASYWPTGTITDYYN